MQGFFFWLGVPGAQYYQILLSLHTLLLVTFRWRPIDFEQKIERHAHKAIFLVALVLATVLDLLVAPIRQCFCPGGCHGASDPFGDDEAPFIGYLSDSEKEEEDGQV